MGEIRCYDGTLLMYPLSSRWTGSAVHAESIESSKFVTERHAITEATRSLYFNNGTRNVQSLPGSTIRLTLSALTPSNISANVCRLGYRVHENQSNQFVMKATIAAVWCVGSEGNVTRSAKKADRILRGQEKILARTFFTATALKRTTDHGDVEVEGSILNVGLVLRRGSYQGMYVHS